MTDDSTRSSDFVSKVRDNTRKYLHEVSEENAVLRQKIEVLACDKQILEGGLVNLQEELEQERAERGKLFARIESMELLRVTSAEEYAVVEEQNNNLASLYSATYSLHGTLDRAEIFAVIQEIVANLIGSEEIGIFECDEESRLRLVLSQGLDESAFATISLEEGIIGESVRSGRPHFADAHESEAEPASYEANLSACVPLSVGDMRIGAIAIFRLLPQKEGIEPIDYELFDLLGSQASVALYTARLHSKYEADDRP